MKVIVTFPKEYASNLYGPAWIEHYGDTPEGFEAFLQDSADWVNGFIDAIEASPYNDTVLFYDLVPEYEEEDLYLGAYARSMYDRGHAPAADESYSQRFGHVLHFSKDVSVRPACMETVTACPRDIALSNWQTPRRT